MTAQALDRALVAALVRAALDEDRAATDVTTRATVPAGQRGRAVFLAKADGVLCGLEVAREAFAQRSAAVEWSASKVDGEALHAGDGFAEVAGPLAAILEAERVALNFLQRLSGVASMTRRFVDLAAPGGAQITDTRKTTPGLRALERYAVRTGGARNHRDTLADGVLIKDNHLAAAARRGLALTEVVRLAREQAPHTLRIEVEVTSPAMAAEAFEAGADIVLLDNMDAETMRTVAASAPTSVLLEASGGVNLDTIAEIAASGVHLVSVGALTHSAPALDVSLEVEPD